MRPLRFYRLYGVCLKSQWSLPVPEAVESLLTEIELFEGSASLFSDASREAMSPTSNAQWFHYACLRDGSTYLRWPGLFEFVISGDGRQIAGRALNGVSEEGEAFQTYLLGQVLSFALLNQGIEPLHATAVVVDGEAVAFIGGDAVGKSSLAAAFLRTGHPLLTDDLFIVNEQGCGLFAQPGPPRIKLFPNMAKALMGEQITSAPMHPRTAKLVIPLSPALCSRAAVPLRAIYVLRPPAARSQGQRITIRTLQPRQAVIKLIAHTFNTLVRDTGRLARQFGQAVRLVTDVPVKSASYTWNDARLPEVVEAIRSDLAHEQHRRPSLPVGLAP